MGINDLYGDDFLDITPREMKRPAWLKNECEEVSDEEASKMSGDLKEQKEEKKEGPKVSGDLGAGKRPGNGGGHKRSSSGSGGQAPARMADGTESDVFHRGDDLNPMVIGAAVAGLLMVIVAVGLFVMRRRRKRSAKGQEAEMGKVVNTSNVVHVPDDSTDVVVDEESGKTVVEKVEGTETAVNEVVAVPESDGGPVAIAVV